MSASEPGPDDFADPNCPGCRGGDKVPAHEPVWRCPVCDAEWHDYDADEAPAPKREDE